MEAWGVLSTYLVALAIDERTHDEIMRMASRGFAFLVPESRTRCQHVAVAILQAIQAIRRRTRGIEAMASVSLLLAAKYYEERLPARLNGSVARASHLTLADVNRLELYVLACLDWTLPRPLEATRIRRTVSRPLKKSHRHNPLSPAMPASNLSLHSPSAPSNTAPGDDHA